MRKHKVSNTGRSSRSVVSHVTMCSRIGRQAASVSEDKSEERMPEHVHTTNRIVAASAPLLRTHDLPASVDAGVAVDGADFGRLD